VIASSTARLTAEHLWVDTRKIGERYRGPEQAAAAINRQLPLTYSPSLDNLFCRVPIEILINRVLFTHLTRLMARELNQEQMNKELLDCIPTI